MQPIGPRPWSPARILDLRTGPTLRSLLTTATGPTGGVCKAPTQSHSYGAIDPRPWAGRTGDSTMATMIHLASGVVQTITDARADLRKSAESIRSALKTGREYLALASVTFAEVHASQQYVATLKASDLADLRADGRKTAWAKFYAEYCGMDKVEASRVLAQGQTILALENVGLADAASYPADTLRAFRKLAKASGEGNAADWTSVPDAVATLTAEGKNVTGPNVRSMIATDGPAEGNNAPAGAVVDLGSTLATIAKALENGTPVVLGTTTVATLDRVIEFLQSRRPVMAEAEAEAAARAAEAENDENDENDEN